MDLLKKIANIFIRICILTLCAGLLLRGFSIFPPLISILEATGNLFLVLPVFLVYFIFKDHKKYSLKLKDSKMPKHFLLGGFIGILSIGIVFIFNLLLGRTELVRINNVIGDPHFYLFLIMMLGVGIGEEVLSRGYMQNMFIYFSNIPVGILLPGLIFAVLHFMNPGALESPIPTVNLILISIVFALMTLYSDSLWTAIGYHFTWNFFQGKIFGLEVSGLEIERPLFELNILKNDFVYGGSFGPEGGLLVTIVLIISIGLLFLYGRNRKIGKLADNRAL